MIDKMMMKKSLRLIKAAQPAARHGRRCHGERLSVLQPTTSSNAPDGGFQQRRAGVSTNHYHRHDNNNNNNNAINIPRLTLYNNNMVGAGDNNSNNGGRKQNLVVLHNNNGDEGTNIKIRTLAAKTGIYYNTEYNYNINCNCNYNYQHNNSNYDYHCNRDHKNYHHGITTRALSSSTKNNNDGDSEISASKSSASWIPTKPADVEKRTKQIHRIPVGSLTPGEWKDSIEDLLGGYWTTSSETEYVKESFSLMERLVNEHKVNQQLTTAERKILDTNILQKVIQNWEKWRMLMPKAESLNPEIVLKLLDNWTDQLDTTLHQQQPFTVAQIYNSIMQSFLVYETLDPKEIVVVVQQIFDRIKTPTSKSYEILMRAHILGGDIDNVLALMDHILRETTTTTTKKPRRKRRQGLRFESTIFEEVLAACVNAKSKRGGLWAEDILDRMHKFYNAGILGLKPGVGYNNFVIHAWSNSGHRQAGERAQNILEHMKQNGPKPNTITYSSVMDAWAQQGDAAQADKLLVEMCNEFMHKGNKQYLKPNILSFNIVLDSLAKSNTRNAGVKAEQHLQLMWRLYDTNVIDFTPDEISYTCVIDAWAGSNHPWTAPRAEKIFYEMLQRSNENKNLAPTTISMTSLANALVKSGELKHAESMIAHLHSEYGVNPNIRTFNTIIDGIARKGGRNSGREAEAFLRKMEQSNQVGVAPNTVNYNSVIHAWAQSGDQQAGREATRLLLEMLNKARGNPDVKPDVMSYTSVIDAWSKSRHDDAGINAEKLLREMLAKAKDDPDVKPGVMSYNSVIDAWSKSGHRDAGFNAEKLLRDMEAKAKEDPDVKPDVLSYTSVINAWASKGNFMAAEAILTEMVGSKDRRLQPNVITFTSVIKALSRSSIANKGEVADKYLKAMEANYQNGQQNTKPNVITYHLVHTCWTKSKSNPKATRRLKEVARQIEELKRKQGGKRSCGNR